MVSDRRWLSLWPVALLALAAILLLASEPLMPAPGLDHGWILAAEHAARTGAVFAHSFVFTYGPFAFLVTHLFDAATFGWVLACDALLVAMWLSPLVMARRGVVIAAYAVALLAAPLQVDTRVVAALFAFALTATQRPGYWTLAVAALLAPLCLSKFSFILVALPILLLLDVRSAAVRRWPLTVATFLAALALCTWASGQPVDSWLLLAMRNWQVISGYSSAMQIAISLGGIAMLGTAATAIAMLAGLTALALRSRKRFDLATAVGAACALWCCFMAFKMGYVRADGHVLITWQFLAMVLGPLAAWLTATARLSKREAVAGAVFAGTIMLTLGGLTIRFANPPVGVADFAVRHVTTLVRQPLRTLAWLAPARWREAQRERVAADARLRHAFPASVQGRVDAMPYRLAELIVSGHDYHPRPVPQSYSAYTPSLQRLDAAHFADPTSAPDTLLFAMGQDIDHRLPTLAPGPTLPVLARWYDPVGRDPLYGLVLRRRAQPRAVREADAGTRAFAIGAWVPVPAPPARGLTLAAFDTEKGIIARAIGFAARESALFIELRRASGQVERFRFIPGMAQVGTAIAPMMTGSDESLGNVDGVEAMLWPEQNGDTRSAVTAFRITGDPMASFAYGGGRVQFRTIAFE